MEKIITTEKIPIKLWLNDIEEGAMQQAYNLANHQHAFHHIAIMPDAHEGYGMPIGAVLATEGVVIPNAVGVDIGCGMCAVKTDQKSISIETLKQILGDMRKVIPVGFSHHLAKQTMEKMPGDFNELPIVHTQIEAARTQIGTLGGGNHFIEIQQGSDEFIWLMVHSGSRNLGKRVADHYNKIAKENRKRFSSSIDLKWQLDFLPIESEEGKMYLNEMQYCINFALANRKLMIENIVSVFKKCTGAKVDMENMINIAHNYASLEKHFGKIVMVHRKGATQARKGQLGIIPGSQGSKSYLVCGLGNSESFESCSHGAGRKIGRNEARRILTLDKEKAILDNQGILHVIRGIRDLDEAPSAYKDISRVMELQKDLVEILVELKPLAVLKG